MPEKSILDSRFQGKSYEKDPSFDTKGEVIFRRNQEDFSGEAILKSVLDDINAEQIRLVPPGKKISMEEFLTEWNKSPEKDRISAMKEMRKKIAADLIINYYTRGYRKTDKQGSIDPKLKNPVINEVKKYLDSIESKYFGDYSDISELTIARGILTIVRGDKRSQIDLVHAIVRDKDPRRADLQKRTQKSTEELKENISTEVYMAGAISVQYEKINTDSRQILNNTAAVMVALHSSAAPLYRIVAIRVRNKEGKMEEVMLGAQKNDTKANLEKSLFGSLRASGYVFDTVLQAFVSATRQAIESSIHAVALSTFEQYRQACEVAGAPIDDTPKNRQKFEHARTKMITDAGRMLDPSYSHERLAAGLRSAGSKLSTIATKAAGLAMETVFWGVFFSAYHKNTQDLAGLGIGIAEVALFRAGSYAGRFIPAPPILKAFTPMLGGIAFSILGHLGANFSDMDKSFWRMFPDREDYWQKRGGKEGNSITGNILTAGPLNEFYDSKQTDLRVGKREGIDMYIPFSNGKIMTIGSLDIGRSTVDMNTPPWEYMGEWIARDIDAWNAQVEKYKNWLTIQVLNIFRQYDEGKGVFEKGNIAARMNGRTEEVTKREILENRLGRLFPHYDANDSGHNGKAIKDIIRQSLESVKIKPELRRDTLMKFFIEGQIDMSMTINKENLSVYKNKIEQEGTFLNEMTEQFAQEFKDPLVSKYIREIFGSDKSGMSSAGRIIEKKRLVNFSDKDSIDATKNKYVITRGAHGIARYQLEEGWEHRTFKGILDSNVMIKSPVLKEILGGGKDISIGDVFYKLLNSRVELKRMKEFVTNVAQTGHAQKWNSGFLEVFGME